MQKTTRRTFLSYAAVTTPRPNLLFIVADSWRGQAFGFAGDFNAVTPNLDRLARESACCTRAYTSFPVCCPSRAAMLTGKYPHAAGVRRNHSLLPLDQPTISATLKSAGYRTGYIGKWHLDGRENDGFVLPERRRGFDEWAAFNLSHKHFDWAYYRDTPTPIRVAGFETEHQVNTAIDFMRRAASQPFYLYLSIVAPHSPFTPPEGYIRTDAATLRLRPNVPGAFEAQVRKDLAGFYGLGTAADFHLGRLLRALDERALTRDTIVVFTSDHGEMHGSHGEEGLDYPYEETTRIPLLIRYPRRIQSSVVNVPISNVDYAPTLLGVCGVDLPRGMQGRNLASALARGRVPSEAIFAEGELGTPNEWRMVVRDPFKLVVDAQIQPTRLYHLTHDPYEMKNLLHSQAMSRVQERLLGELRNWMTRTGT